MMNARTTYRQRQTSFRHLQTGTLVVVNAGVIIGLLLTYPAGSEFKVTDWLWLLAVAVFTGVVLKLLHLIGEKPPRLFCTHCGKYIDPRMEWQCGYCDHHNTTHLFLEQCVNCKEPPKALRCPHCQGVNPLVAGDIDEFHTAFNPDSVKVAEPVDIKVERQEILETKRYDVDAAKLDLELTEIMAKMPKPPEPPPKKRTQAEIINADYEQHFARDTAIDDLKQRELKRLREQYRDDPEEYERQKERLQCWVESKLE